MREHGKVMASQAHSDSTMKLLASNVVKAIRGSKDPLLWNRLHDAAVTAKCTLSKEEITTIYLPMFLGPKYNVKLSLTRKNLRAYPKACFCTDIKAFARGGFNMSGVNLPGESGRLGIFEGAFADDDEGNDYDYDSGSKGKKHNTSSTRETKFAGLRGLVWKCFKEAPSCWQEEARERRKRKGSTIRVASTEVFG